MIEVIVFRNGRVVDTASDEDPANAVYAGQILFDESQPPRYRVNDKPQVGFYVDGKLVRLVDGRPHGGVLTRR